MSETKAGTKPHSPMTLTEPRIVPALLSLSKLTRALIGIRLAEHGFHNGQDELLIALDETAPVSVTHMADALAVRPSTVSKMLDRVIEKGLVERIDHVKDARRTMIQLTPLGIDMKSKLLKLRNQFEDDLMLSLSDNAESTVQSLESVAAVLKQRLNRLR